LRDERILIGIRWGGLAVSILICQVAGLLGAVFTVQAIPSWYQTLQKPSFQPPSWVFGPVWTLLYTLMGIALYRIWILSEATPGREAALGVFAAQWFLNALWTPVFFGWKKTWVAFGVIVLMLAAIVGTMVLFSNLDTTATWLLAPYVAWVSFAVALNFSIARLNSK
jgi:tryptophan-rich sensory protein